MAANYVAGDPVHISQEAICEIISNEANVPVEALKEDVRLASLDIASLDLIGVSFVIEDRFGLVLNPDGLTEQSTVGDLIGQIQALAAVKAPT